MTSALARGDSDVQFLTLHVPFAVAKRGGRKLVVVPDGVPQERPRIDSALVEALVREFRWQRMLNAGDYATLQDLARAEIINLSNLIRVLRLTLLAPTLVEAAWTLKPTIPGTLPAFPCGFQTLAASSTFAARIMATRGSGMVYIHEGGCQCGKVRYAASGDPKRVTVCHCTWCQRRTGSAFAVEALFTGEQVTIRGQTRRYRSISDESGRWLDLEFCERCGGTIGFTFERLPGHRMIDCGTFDEPGWLTPERFEFRYVYLRSAQCWSRIPDGVQAFDAFFPT